MSTSSRQFKTAIYEQFARVGNALASPPRLELLDLLSQGPRAVEALAREAGQSVANTSHHLQVLRRARLVAAAKDGVRVTYRLADAEVSDLFRAVRHLAESRLLEIAEVAHQFVAARGAMEMVDRQELVERVRSGAVTVLDVRPAEEYAAGHLPGAISIPVGEIKRRLAELPRDRAAVAYCRGPYCVMAIEAVEVLRANGFDAHRLEDGVPDWRARGLPVEAEEAA